MVIIIFRGLKSTLFELAESCIEISEVHGGIVGHIHTFQYFRWGKVTMFVAVPEIPASLTFQGEQHCVFDLTVLVTFLNVFLHFGPSIGIL